MQAQKRARKVRKAIRLAWGSLDSHLKYTYAHKLPKHESRKFHKKCVREYATTIKLLSELY